MPLPSPPATSYPPRSVIEGLDRGFRIEQAEGIERWKHDDDPRIHVSEVKGCSRYVVLNRFFIPDTHEKPIDEMMVMEVGKALHEKYQTYLKRSGFLVRADFEHDKWVVGDDLFVGHPDADYILVGGSEIVDFKSIRQGGWERLNGPKEDDVVQVTCYMGLTGRRKGRLVYVSRDSGKRKEFAFDFNPLLWAEARQDAKALLLLIEDALANGAVPPIPPHLREEQGKGFPCWYRTKDNADGFFCSKYGHCWGASPIVRIPVENVLAARKQFGWTPDAEEEVPHTSIDSVPARALAAAPQPLSAKVPPTQRPLTATPKPSTEKPSVAPSPGVLTP